MFRLIKMIKDKGRWRIFKLKLIDARLYFVSIFVGLLTGLVAVPYHYLLQFFFNLRHDFFDSRPKWYWYIPLFLLMWGILVFVSWLVKKMPLITGGGIPQTRGVINGRVDYKHPFLELVAKFVGGILALSTGLSLGREGPSVQIGSYVGYLVSKWGRVLSGERKQLLSAGAGAGLAAAFAAPLASSLLVIESIERFDAPKTAITTLLAGVVAGGVASWIFPINPYFHIDAMDGKFVKNNNMEKMKDYALKINTICMTCLDVHLMVENPKEIIEDFVDFNPDRITFHLEACKDKEEVMDIIKYLSENGIKASIAINPDTDISKVYEFLPYIHMVLVMTVVPGLGGQSLIPGTLDKVSTLKKYCDENDFDIDIEVDGGINDVTSEKAVEAGANILVVGSYVWKSDDYTAAINKIR